jgi:hypothetical protein
MACSARPHRFHRPLLDRARDALGDHRPHRGCIWHTFRRDSDCLGRPRPHGVWVSRHCQFQLDRYGPGCRAAIRLYLQPRRSRRPHLCRRLHPHHARQSDSHAHRHNKRHHWERHGRGDPWPSSSAPARCHKPDPERRRSYRFRTRRANCVGDCVSRSSLCIDSCGASQVRAQAAQAGWDSGRPWELIEFMDASAADAGCRKGTYHGCQRGPAGPQYKCR